MNLCTATLGHQDRLSAILHIVVLKSILTHRYSVGTWLDNTRGRWTWRVNFFDRMFRIRVYFHSGVILSRTHSSLLKIKLGADLVVCGIILGCGHTVTGVVWLLILVLVLTVKEVVDHRGHHRVSFILRQIFSLYNHWSFALIFHRAVIQIQIKLELSLLLRFEIAFLTLWIVQNVKVFAHRGHISSGSSAILDNGRRRHRVRLVNRVWRTGTPIFISWIQINVC